MSEKTPQHTTSEMPDHWKQWRKIIREAVGNFPIAIASGISSLNVDLYTPYANYFLVSSAISKNFTELDPRKVRELAWELRG